MLSVDCELNSFNPLTEESWFASVSWSAIGAWAGGMDSLERDQSSKTAKPCLADVGTFCGQGLASGVCLLLPTC